MRVGKKGEMLNIVGRLSLWKGFFGLRLLGLRRS